MTHPQSKLLAPEALNALLAQSPAPRVKPLDIDARIKDIQFFRLTETITVCQITLDNGYSVRGESACVCVENYNQAIGEHFAEKQARDKLWPVMGLLLAEELFQAKQDQPTPAASGPYSDEPTTAKEESLAYQDAQSSELEKLADDDESEEVEKSESAAEENSEQSQAA